MYNQWSVVNGTAWAWLSLSWEPSLLDIDKVWNARHASFKKIFFRFLKDLKKWKITEDEALQALSELDMDSDGVIKKVNDIYRYVINYLKEELFYTEKELSQVSDITFSSFQDILQFLRHTNRPRGKIFCTVAKKFLAVFEWHQDHNERIKIVKEKTSRVLSNKLRGPLQIVNENENEWQWVVAIYDRIIPFSLVKREKSDNSNISKGARDPRYSTSDHASDSYWVAFLVDKREDLLLLMEFVVWKVFKKKIYDIKAKWDGWHENKSLIIDHEELSPEFKDKLLPNVHNASKLWTADWYEDIRAYTPYSKDGETKNLSLEIKFVLSENSNEKGLQMHWVYWYFRRILERIRDEWYVWEEYLERVSARFLDDLGDILKDNLLREDKDVSAYKTELFQELKRKRHILWRHDLRRPEAMANRDKYLKNGLVSYFKTMLESVRVWNSKKSFYATKRSIEMSLLGVISENIVPSSW